uniref:Ribosomal protein S1 n=1 Tax=Rhodochaete parvula TaxID=110510 RepID=A0A1X9PUR1_9RHOD|nr:30S ribosomal protein S1 [Rhodochaete parvula]ASK39671.1 ribosomal protein S1 [Rhodochaete parvula]
MTISSLKFIHNNLETVLKKYNYSLNKGDIIAGIVFSEEKYGFLINIGNNIAGYLPYNEILDTVFSKTIKQHNFINLSESREFLIIERKKVQNKQVLLSVKKLNYIKSWERIKQLYTEDITLYTKIIGKNKGGILVDIENLVGFIPNSHANSSLFQSNFITNYKKVLVKFLEINETHNYIIVSCKRVILQSYSNKFNVGTIINGTVKNIQKYGVFVDLGEINGLLHISEITNNHVESLQQIFEIGDKIWVSIIHIDTKQARISLSTKFLD